MKKEKVLELIEKEIKVSVEQMEDFESKKDYQDKLRSFRKEISESKAIALDIYGSVKEKLSNMDQISVVTAINKITLSFGHLGTSIKENRDFDVNIIISEFLKEKAGSISASIAKDMLKELIDVFVENPEFVQVSNYENALRKKLTKNKWIIGEEYEAKKKTLPTEFFEQSIPQPVRQIFSEYIKFRGQFRYPYAMVINSAADIKPIVDSAEMSSAVEKERYTDQNGNYIQSYEALNIFQRIDWLRRKLEKLIEKIDSFDAEEIYNIHLTFSTMELHDARVLFGHLLTSLK